MEAGVEEPVSRPKAAEHKANGVHKRRPCCGRAASCKSLFWGDTTTADLVLPPQRCAPLTVKKYTWLFYMRLVLLLWTICIIIAQLAVEQPWAFYFCYLTIWGWWSLMVHFLLAVVVTVRYNPDDLPSKERELDCLEKACFVSFSLCCTFAVIVSLLYWLLLFDLDNFDEASDWVFGINNHVLNTVIALITFFTTRIAPKLVHVAFSFLIAALYVAANAGCSVSNGRDAYSVLPWLEPNASTVYFAIGGVVVGCLVFCLIFGLAKVRDKTFCKPSKDDIAQTEPQVEAAESTVEEQQISIT